MADTKWHSGPPPSLGWWPASIGNMSGIYRWWDGIAWGEPCYKGTPIERVAQAARIRSWVSEQIQWQHRPASWPARSRT